MKDEMTPRERFLTALNGGQPDRVPMFEFLFSQEVYQAVIGRRPEVYNAEDAVELSAALGLDGVFIPLSGSALFEPRAGDELYQDEWGTTWRPAPTWPNDAPVDFPVKNRGDWKKYKVPDLTGPDRTREFEKALKMMPGRSRQGVLGCVLGPFTAAWFITGLDSFFLLMYDDPELVDEVLWAVTETWIAAGKRMVESGADAIILADDLGGTYGPLISIEQFRRHILPPFEHMTRALKELVPVLMHNDGDIKLYLDELVATGIDGYHPVERNAGMDLAGIKGTYGSDLCLVGNVNNKITMVGGRPDDVEEAVKECLRIAGPGGGFILGSDHSLHDDIPIDNVYALFESGKKYGSYPLCL